MAALSGEKIDVIPGSDDASVFVANALSPAQVISVDLDEEHRIASVTVPERMLSLAIGREGQNARLAARLTGWRIDIRSDVSVAEARAAADAATTEEPAAMVAAGADGTPTPAVAEAPVKAKRVTKKAAAAAEAAGADDATTAATADLGSTDGVDAPKKARTTKATTKKATAAAESPAAEVAPEPPVSEDAPAAKPKRTRKAAAAVPSEEVAS